MTRLIPMALAAGWMVLPICVLRWLLQRCPKKYLVLLWVPVAMRLCLPLQIQSTVSLVPTALSRLSYEPSQRLLFLWLCSCVWRIPAASAETTVGRSGASAGKSVAV